VNGLEIAANVVMTASIALAARNSVHTWSTGIAGCLLFMVLFLQKQLYADATLQLFFIISSVIGWWQWCHPGSQIDQTERQITRVRPGVLVIMFLLGISVAVGYGWILRRFTDAYLPYVDSAVLALSIIAQFLLMWRTLDTWICWLAVNTISIALFTSRDLYLTAALYTAYWFNAWYGWSRWRRAISPRLMAQVTI
jgi:nicotinamide mononucleotide transporter